MIKKLREEIGAGVVEAKKALEEFSGDYQKAKEFLQKKGLVKVSERKERETLEGIIEAYIHSDKKTGVLVEILCETDFVSRNSQFQALAHEIAMQVAAMNPKNQDELLNQAWIKDEKVTIDGLIKNLAAKVGENITLKRFIRFKLAED